jgi:hypothetical protein
VPLLRGRKRSHNVNVQMRKSEIWNWDGVEGSCRLFVDLATLALLAISAHCCNISAHALPHETCRDHSLGGTFTRVGHAVDGLEYCRPVHLWYQGSDDSLCYVAQQAGSLDLDSPYYQGGGLSGLQHARKADLVGRHLA